MKDNTRNRIIDRMIQEGVTDNQLIITEVQKVFPEVPVGNIKRQVYSRRNSLKKTATTSQSN